MNSCKIKCHLQDKSVSGLSKVSICRLKSRVERLWENYVKTIQMAWKNDKKKKVCQTNDSSGSAQSFWWAKNFVKMVQLAWKKFFVRQSLKGKTGEFQTQSLWICVKSTLAIIETQKLSFRQFHVKEFKESKTIILGFSEFMWNQFWRI